MHDQALDGGDGDAPVGPFVGVRLGLRGLGHVDEALHHLEGEQGRWALAKMRLSVKIEAVDPAVVHVHRSCSRQHDQVLWEMPTWRPGAGLQRPDDVARAASVLLPVVRHPRDGSNPCMRILARRRREIVIGHVIDGSITSRVLTARKGEEERIFHLEPALCRRSQARLPSRRFPSQRLPSQRLPSRACLPSSG